MTAPFDPAIKILDATTLDADIARLPRPLVFTNGVFDILHTGHARYLAQARALGATLLVGLNADSSARMLGKGPERPINREQDRAYLLAALGCVDAVALFSERTPVELISRIRPDIYVKGGDYDIEALEETHLVRTWGGHAQTLPFVDGYSTTSIVTKMRQGAPS